MHLLHQDDRGGGVLEESDPEALKLLEFLEDRLYLSAFANSPPKSCKNSYCFFTVQDTLIYNSFFHDFGPLNIAHLYRFALILHDVLQTSAKQKNKPVVFYSKPDLKSRSNAAFLLACYMVLIQEWPPHLALTPLYDSEQPFLPFRDAGYALADYVLSIQDYIFGVWRAHEYGLLNVRELNLEEYEEFERVENGDLNWVSKHFIAFASPIQPDYPNVKPDAVLPQSFDKVLKYFTKHGVKAVVRLNSPLYDRNRFVNIGLEHYDLCFDDGTVPPFEIVHSFIKLCEETFRKSNDSVIAVHCKAGLGRTGCLMGAYLIFKYGFTANEVMAYMRFLRPGMVVGPQQHWLHINQQKFREWYFEDLYREKTDENYITNGENSANKLTTPPRPPLAEVRHKNQEENPLPAPTPGQPRKIDINHNHSDASENSLVSPFIGKMKNKYDDSENVHIRPYVRMDETLFTSRNGKSFSYKSIDHSNRKEESSENIEKLNSKGIRGLKIRKPSKLDLECKNNRITSAPISNDYVKSKAASQIRTVSGGISLGRIMKSRTIKKRT